MGEHLWWYVARASGIVAWGLLTASILWGFLTATHILGKRPRPAWVLDLHRHLGGLAVVFVLVHLAALLLDSYVEFSIVDLLVPFAATWRPGALAWGIVAFYVLLAVEITSLLKRHLPQRAWRLVHWGSYPLFAFATLHLIYAGSDSTNVAVVIALAVGIAEVVFLLIVRLFVRETGALTPFGTRPDPGAAPPPATPDVFVPVPAAEPPLREHTGGPPSR